MAQIKTGTAEVTNGSNLVVSSTGVSWTGVTPNNSVFSLDFVRGAPLYPIIAVELIGEVDGLWRLTLAVPYNEATDAAAAYLIQKDFVSLSVDDETFYLPIFEVSDTQTLPIFNRAMTTILAAMSKLAARKQVRQIASLTALAAYDTTFMEAGEFIFVTDPAYDATSIYQLQAGAPAGSDKVVAGNPAMRFRQTGGA
jgi:hypothetical protein